MIQQREQRFQEWQIMFIILAGIVIVTALLSGCRTYNVYQFGTLDNNIKVNAEVEKEINPQVKASLK